MDQMLPMRVSYSMLSTAYISKSSFFNVCKHLKYRFNQSCLLWKLIIEPRLQPLKTGFEK